MRRSDRDTRARVALPRIALLCLVLFLLGATPAAASGWLDPVDLSLPGRNAGSPLVATDNLANTVAMWDREKSVVGIDLQLTTRASGADFSPPADLLGPIEAFDLAMTPGGEAAAVWRRLENPPGVHVIQVATRPPGGSFSAPVTIYTAPAGIFPQDPQVAIGEGGDIAVTWGNEDPKSGLDELVCEENPTKVFCNNPTFIEASARPAGGSFSPPVRISPPRGTEEVGESEEEKEEREIEESKMSAIEAQVAVDPQGRAVAVWSYFDGEDQVVQSAAEEGAGFSSPQQVSASGESAGEPEVGMDAAGNAIAAWTRNEGVNGAVQAGVRPPGGSFSVLANVSGSTGSSAGPSLAVNPSGTATVAWRLTGSTTSFIQTATRPPGGVFSSPLSLSSGKDNPLFPEVALNGAGSAVVVWSGDNSSNKIVRASVRPEGGAFGAPVAISQSSPDLFHPHVAMDLAGDATVVWKRNNGFHDIIQEAGYDGSPPELRDVSIPSSAKVGEPVPFSASGVDEWPIGPPHFNFGDGGAADGTSAVHAYSAPGAYLVTVTDTDAGGTTATATGTTLVKPRNNFKIGKLTRNRRTGTATLEVTIPEPGSVSASGKGIRKTTVRSARGGTVKLTLKAAGKGLKRLGQDGKLKAKLKVVYSPTGGDPSSSGYRVTLLKKLG